MSRAMELGLYHPNCKDSHTTYFEDITEKGAVYTKKELKQIEDDYKADQKQQYAERQADKYDRLSKYSLDEDNKKVYCARAEEWKYEENAYKYPINEGNFETFNASKNIDLIRPHNIIKNLYSSDIGTDTYNYIKDNKIRIKLLYGIDNPENLMGEYDPIDDTVYVYVDKTKSILETAKTIIHEITHRKNGCKGTRKEEVRCFISEMMHDNDKLTIKDIKAIIKMVNDNDYYSKLPWR